ncbi:3-oxoacyl-[acyl-carrier-protein] synthase [Cutibacterium acnes JCM 18918]|nr:3-oxoacyl-[acyl-carrier-protein] synthase [Cutibacterium acnes JCM 18918]
MTAIKTRPVHGYSKFLSTGSARGSRVVTNKEMCTLIDSTPEWIEQRTGITERRWATNSETVASMGTTAARTALERSGLEASQIDAIIVATVSHHRPSPSLAAYIARELGLGDAAAFDLNGACAGFCYSTALADSMIRTGSANYVLVIGVEKLSEMTNLDDRSTAFLFSDGLVPQSSVPAMSRGSARWCGDLALISSKLSSSRTGRRLALIPTRFTPSFAWKVARSSSGL